MTARPRDRKPPKARGPRGIFRTKFSCCGKTMHSNRAQKAHHLAEHSGRWSSKAARAAGRAMGREADKARRHALGWLESAGLREWREVPVRGKDGKQRTRKDGSPMTRQVPVRTAKDRARPELRGRVRLRNLRSADRHDRDSGRTDTRARRHETRAARSDGRAERAAARAARLKQARLTPLARRVDARAATHRTRAATHRTRVADQRMGHHQRWPERTRA